MDIKICGLTRLDDALAALDSGADYLGLVFYPGSTRAVTPEQAESIGRRLPPDARIVGVFVDVTPALASRIAGQCRLHAIQLHGSEDVAAFDKFPLPVWRAVKFRDGKPVPSPQSWPADRYVADSQAPEASHSGGSGRLTDWEAAGRLACRVPTMLAGGLTPENVAAALRHVRPCGVDIAGGIEIPGVPGRKDYARMRLFIETARMTQ